MKISDIAAMIAGSAYHHIEGNVVFWPFTTVRAAQSHVRSWAERKSPAEAQTGAFDPTETRAPQDCCDAERVDIKKDYGGKIVRNANGATPLPSVRYLIA